ncbi:MAG: NfeD family protein [Pseudoalteromonas sp.]|uniref:NfeD family protein n=1 Tax=unclassified Pseudoalteromonas TaxID=194690 RepID=UPI003F99126E
MEFIIDNLAQSLMILGILALIIEVAVLGMSTFILLFLGMSLFATGLMMNFSLLEESLTTALWSNIVATTALTLLLWQPLKRMQEHTDTKEVHSDFAQLSFVLSADVDEQGLTTHSYSGINWQLKSNQPISAGTEVTVVKKEVGVMWVAPL